MLLSPPHASPRVASIGAKQSSILTSNCRPMRSFGVCFSSVLGPGSLGWVVYSRATCVTRPEPPSHELSYHRTHLTSVSLLTIITY